MWAFFFFWKIAYPKLRHSTGYAFDSPHSFEIVTSIIASSEAQGLAEDKFLEADPCGPAGGTGNCPLSCRVVHLVRGAIQNPLPVLAVLT